MVTVNITLELENNEEVLSFEHWIKQYVNVKDLTILPDTKELYENDTHFKKLTKKYYEAKKLRNDYINDKNFK